ncbi:ceramidase NDAI_0E02710 [Naumovozyma dairenensis CBS 421]|uniref:Uncharacterized protein n=1 Tax=Naumovozyma dairenensis (strain ATCC 10597 / BCRC 20456 / CBS 421 / NBRC 0211 / NRRL Y-12639) TaxID=1071378 RepID=G0WBG8_NAUDC|nr:hypothetical protein NDAI_0E02710 [Naumovozyma dairenensis CBS 421]CCD25088.1 hypothetical protein NDAI_0E02710 [Naumovozyma dairenensis CBS 421]
MDYLRWPYPEESQSGFWGETTAIIDWCEENYVVSNYIAEWSNTLTNLGFVMAASYSIYCAYRNKLEKRFILIGLGFALVGVGSWLFHMTLKFHFQLLDELPMVYATSIPSWSLFSEIYHLKKNENNTSDGNSVAVNVNNSENKKIPLKEQLIFGGLITAFVSFLTWVYLVKQDPIIFQVLYGFLNVLVVSTSGYIAYKNMQTPTTKRNLFATMGLGISLFLAGFIFWQLDVHFCSFWIGIRRKYLLLPLGVLLELHGWWHLLTGAGVYAYVVFLQYLRVLSLGELNDFDFIWRWKFCPELVRKDASIGTKYSYQFLGPYVDKPFDSLPTH